MKRMRDRLVANQSATVEWIRFVTLVLAFIGLWQMLSGGVTVLDRWL